MTYLTDTERIRELYNACLTGILANPGCQQNRPDLVAKEAMSMAISAYRVYEKAIADGIKI